MRSLSFSQHNTIERNTTEQNNRRFLILSKEYSQVDMPICPSRIELRTDDRNVVKITKTTQSVKQYANSTLQPIQPYPSKETTLQGGKHHLPCNARLVPPDHNEETAYFEISPDAKHGMPLTCCHPACARRQTKRPRFRYCAVCCSAVSSQNFYHRHSHPRVIQTNSENTSLQSAFAEHT